MSRFATLQALNVDDAIPDAWVDEVKAIHDWTYTSGGNLASASTVNPTAGYHNLTGTTQVNTITDSNGAVAGQQLYLKVVGSAGVGAIIGTSGNILPPGGGATYFPVGDIIELVYDGTNWLILNPPSVVGWSQYFDLVSSAAMTALFTQSVPGGTIGAGGGLEILMIADYINNSGANRNLSLKVTYGATDFWGDQASLITPSSTRRGVFMHCILSAENSPTSLRLVGDASIGSLNSGSIAGFGVMSGFDPFMYTQIRGTLSAAEDSRNATNLIVSAQHSSSASTIEIRGTIHVKVIP